MKEVLFAIGLSLCFRVNGQDTGTPPVPENLSAEIVQKGGTDYIRLSWDRAPSDTITYGYLIYHNFPPEETLYRNNAINVITENSVDFEIKKTYASNYLFAIEAVSSFENRKNSGLSPTLSIKSPSRILPTVDISNVQPGGDGILISWEYPEILDLKSFTIMANGKTIMTVPPEKREIRIENTFQEKKLRIQMIATSETNVESRICKPFFVTNR